MAKLNWQMFCNVSSNYTFNMWDQNLKTFNQCFLWIGVLIPSCILFVLVGGFLLGRSSIRRMRCQQPFSLWIVRFIVLLQVIKPTTEIILSCVLKGVNPTTAFILAKGTEIIAWITCFLIFRRPLPVYYLKMHTNILLCAFFVVFIGHLMQIHVAVVELVNKDIVNIQIIGSFVTVFLDFAFLLPCLKIVCIQRSYPVALKNTSIQEALKNEGMFLGKAEATCSILSHTFFWWANKLMLKGKCGQLKEPDDLFILPSDLQISMIQDRFESFLHAHQNIKSGVENEVNFREPQRSVFRSLNKSFGCIYYSLGIIKFICDCLGFAGPILLNYLVSFIDNKQENSWDGYYFAFALFVTKAISSILFLQYRFHMEKVGMKIKAALVTSIYKKTLLTCNKYVTKFSHGQVMNYMSTDTNCVVNFCQSFHAFWSLPFQIAVCLYLLYQQVDLAFLSGLAFIILLIPLNKWIAVKIGTISKDMMKQKDERVKLVSEIFHGIRAIKLYVWERFFLDKIRDVRFEELACLKKRKYLDALCVYFWAATPVLISIITFSTYVQMGGQLTAAKVFTSIALFNMLIAPLNAFPWVLNGLMEAWVSLNRIQVFMSQKDLNMEGYYTRRTRDENVFQVQNAFFGLTGVKYSQTNENESLLKNISLAITKGSFVGITGQVGSGKSLLLAALSAEIFKEDGQIFLCEDNEGFGFVMQECWIQQGTIRDNILFGKMYNKELYDKVVFACALLEDFEQLPCGDDTNVGEGGSTLSGGQRARVALARAVYQDKECYLLDCPLAAVDAEVAHHIFKHCFMGLLNNKTRVLISHQSTFLQHTDKLVYMENGYVKSEGEPSEVLSKHNVVQNLSSNKQNEEIIDSVDKENVVASLQVDLIEDELQISGEISGNVYKAYWQSVGNILSLFIVMFIVLMQASRNTSDWWLSYWVTETKSLPSTNSTMYYLKVYMYIGAGNSFFTLVRAFLFAYGGIRAAREMHKRLLTTIINKSLFFFDKTPIGRILNRFSSDTYSIDDSLTFMLNIFFANSIGLLGTLIVSCYGVPWFSLFLIPLAPIYYYTQLYYRKTSRELKRLSTVTLSPIYEHFSETISGATTIRALRQSARFAGENKMILDSNLRADYSGLVGAMWLFVRLNVIGVTMVTFISLLAVVQHSYSSINPGLVGLAISYALSLTDQLNGVVTSFTETEKQMVSVERVMEYINDACEDQHMESCVDDNPIIQRGSIVFNDVSLQYRDTSGLALDRVSFDIKPGEKIGICGRTGAGKSSLFWVLFKTVQPQSGEIFVGGKDCSQMKAEALRSQMAIIPQKAFIFEDTVRRNLDPFDEHSTNEIVEALKKCFLFDHVTRIGGLEAVIDAGKFSCGEQQLFCLARALLRNSKIICMDEATSNIDVMTDRLIQQTLQNEFRSSTVLTIAHRMDTIANCDRIFTMDGGKLTE